MYAIFARRGIQRIKGPRKSVHTLQSDCVPDSAGSRYYSILTTQPGAVEPRCIGFGSLEALIWRETTNFQFEFEQLSGQYL